MDYKPSPAHTFHGGPAFPSVEMPDCVRIFPGMELRDYFAAQALPMMIGELGKNEQPLTNAGLAARAYGIADAMLKHRLL